MSRIISNATPLITFARINQLPLLQQVVGTLIIPTAVADEISVYVQGKPGAIDLNQEPWIQPQSLQSRQQVQLLLPTLDLGEAEVIALALESQAPLILMDELTGRKVAESLNLKVSGSIGVLIRAKQLGYLPEIKALIAKMRQTGIYFSDRFIQAVLQQVGE
jgi:uncharacterized protein